MRTMKSWPTTAILVVAALGAVVALPQTPLSSAITYQGRLESAGVPYPLPTADLEFLLYDAATGGTLIDSDIRPGVLVVDGFFSTEILFNAANAYNGDARWLEIWVNGTQLLPRQELTPAPFAIYALNATGGGSCLWEESGSDIYYNDGRVGIGTNDPDAALHVAGVSRFGGEQMGAGGVPGDWMMIEAQPGQIDHVTLRFDQEWLSFWNPNASPNEILRLTDEGNLGIAFSNPDTRLAVYGDIALPFSGALRVTNQDFGSRTILRTGWDAALGDYLDLYTPGARTDDDEARVRITQSGYVGIGTLQPETMLDVVGTVQTTGLQLPTGAGAGYVLTSDATGWPRGNRAADSRCRIPVRPRTAETRSASLTLILARPSRVNTAPAATGAMSAAVALASTVKVVRPGCTASAPSKAVLVLSASQSDRWAPESAGSPCNPRVRITAFWGRPTRPTATPATSKGAAISPTASASAQMS